MKELRYAIFSEIYPICSDADEAEKYTNKIISHPEIQSLLARPTPEEVEEFLIEMFTDRGEIHKGMHFLTGFCYKLKSGAIMRLKGEK